MTTATAPAQAPTQTLPDVLTVKVTDEDLLLGKRCDSDECPIARAIRRTLTLQGYGPLDVAVGGSHGPYASVAWIDTGRERRTYENDSSLFVSNFDSGLNPAPCTVTLTALA